MTTLDMFFMTSAGIPTTGADAGGCKGSIGGIAGGDSTFKLK